MKLFRLLFIFFFLSLFLITVYADEGRIRTRDNLMIPSDVIVNSENIEDIMKTPSVDSKEKIYDFINILSSDEKNDIYHDILEFQKISKLDCVIVLTDSLNGFEINQYAYHFYDYNDFSKEGIIFVVSIQDKKIFMGNNGNRNSIVYSIYTDQEVQNILKNVYTNVKIDNYYQAFKDYMHFVKDYYESSNKVTNENLVEKNDSFDFVILTEIFIISLSLTFIITLLLYTKLKKRMENDHLQKIDSSTMNYTLVKDQIIN